MLRRRVRFGGEQSVGRRRFRNSRGWSQEPPPPTSPTIPQPVWPVVPTHAIAQYVSPFLVPRKLAGFGSAYILIDDVRDLAIEGQRHDYAFTLRQLEASYQFPNPPEIPAFPQA